MQVLDLVSKKRKTKKTSLAFFKNLSCLFISNNKSDPIVKERTGLREREKRQEKVRKGEKEAECDQEKETKERKGSTEREIER